MIEERLMMIQPQMGIKARRKRERRDSERERRRHEGGRTLLRAFDVIETTSRTVGNKRGVLVDEIDQPRFIQPLQFVVLTVKGLRWIGDDRLKSKSLLLSLICGRSDG